MNYDVELLFLTIYVYNFQNITLATIVISNSGLNKIDRKYHFTTININF